MDLLELTHGVGGQAALLAFGEHHSPGELVAELGREDEAALVVQARVVGAEEHSSHHPFTIHRAPMRPTLLHFPPPSTAKRPLDTPWSDETAGQRRWGGVEGNFRHRGAYWDAGARRDPAPARGGAAPGGIRPATTRVFSVASTAGGRTWGGVERSGGAGGKPEKARRTRQERPDGSFSLELWSSGRARRGGGPTGPRGAA